MPPLEDVSSDEDELMSMSEEEWQEMRREISDELMTEAKGASDETDRFIASFRHFTGLHPSNDLLSFLAGDSSAATSYLPQTHPTPEPTITSTNTEPTQNDPPIEDTNMDSPIERARQSRSQSTDPASPVPAITITSPTSSITVKKPTRFDLTPTPLINRIASTRQNTPALPQIPVFLVRTRSIESDSRGSTPGMTPDKTDDQAPGDDADRETPDPLDQLPRPSSITSSHLLNGSAMPAPLQPILIPTRPSSPIANTTLRRDPFGRSRLITRGGLVRCLEAEADRISQMSPSERIMREEPGYAEYEARMRQTLERLEELSDDEIGGLRPFRIFLLGLIAFLNYKDLERTQATLDRARSTATQHNPSSTDRRRMHVSPPPSERAPSPPGTERVPTPPLPAPAADDTADPEQPAAPDSAATDPPAYDDTQERIPQCPSRPPNTRDPRSVWIGDRAYYPGGANNYVRDAATV